MFCLREIIFNAKRPSQSEAQNYKWSVKQGKYEAKYEVIYEAFEKLNRKKYRKSFSRIQEYFTNECAEIASHNVLLNHRIGEIGFQFRIWNTFDFQGVLEIIPVLMQNHLYFPMAENRIIPINKDGM